jgi:uncharacterized protein (TIGR00255 family)
MIRSMTGFGEAEAPTPAGRLRVELRSVNHRYLNVNARLPAALARFEPELREWLRGSFTRGHVNCTVRVESDGDSTVGGLQLDEERVSAYLALFRQLGERFEVPGTVDLALLSRYNDIFRRREEDEIEPVTAEQLRAVVEEAARRAAVMREDEGRRLLADLEGRLDGMGRELAVIAARAPARLEAERDRLRDAVRELAAGVAVDEARLAQEIAYLAERLDINEELVRFRSHLEHFRELLGAPAAEAVGKRLSFLVQEMHREANTIGSKANDARIAQRVILIKEEIERLREQVENVE